jgi:hypothetical protein
MNFTDPTIISQGLSNDQVIVDVKNTALFQSAESHAVLQPDKSSLVQFVPRLLPKGVDATRMEENAGTASNGMMGLLVLQLAVSFFLKNKIDDLWNLFFTLQIMVYLTIYDIRIPANAEVYIAQARKIIEFEILNVEVLVQKFIDPSFSLKRLLLPSKEAIVSEDQEKSILNEMRMFIMIGILGLLILILALILGRVKKFRDKITAKLQTAKKKFLYNGTIRSVYLTYMKLAISVADQLGLYAAGSDFSDPSNVKSAWAVLAWLLLVPTAGALFLLSQGRKDKQGKFSLAALGREAARRKYGSLYTDISLKRAGIGGILFFPIFLLRRLLFVLFPKLFLA